MAVITRFLFMISMLDLVHKAVTIEQCNGPRQLPVRDKMLNGHTYKTRWARSGFAECLFVCREEKVCQSFNFVVKESKCEFNNRTKEACRPEDFVSDPDRLYVKLDVSRVPLGSDPELPATSCHEINANEGKRMDDGTYWMLLSGKIVRAFCNMTSQPEDIDECSADPPICTNGRCNNTVASYHCFCHPGFTGNGKTCSDIDECAGNLHDCHVNTYCDNTCGSYKCLPYLNGSTILRNDSRYLEPLTSFLKPVVNSSVRCRFVRCWHAKKDGWAASTFHGNCDDKGPTVTIIQVGSFIFGGYSDVSWKNFSSCRTTNSTKAFIYSLMNYNNVSGYAVYNPVKAEIIRWRSNFTSVPVKSCASRGPFFNIDVEITNNAATKRDSRTYCGVNYDLPTGADYGKACKFYAGTYRFTPTDVEVFYETTS